MNCHSDVPSPSGVIKLPVKDELLTIRGFQTQPEKSGKKKVELGEKGITATLLVSHDENVIWIRRIAPKKRECFFMLRNKVLCSLLYEWMLYNRCMIFMPQLRKHWSIGDAFESNWVSFRRCLRSHALLWIFLSFGLLFISLSFTEVLFIIKNIIIVIKLFENLSVRGGNLKFLSLLLCSIRKASSMSYDKVHDFGKHA